MRTCYGYVIAFYIFIVFTITNSVMKVAEKAEEECDRMTLNFIDWFIGEQVEEEEAIKNIIKRLELFGEDKVALYLMDKELGERGA